MSVLRIVIILIIPLIAIAVTVAIALAKGKKTQISSSDIFISVLPIIIGAVIAFFAVFLIVPIGPILLLEVISIVISAVLLNSKLANGKSLNNSQNTAVPATVVSKRYDVIGENIAYCVSFNIEGKGITEFTVPLSQFEIMNEGESGTITYRDNVFFSFTR